MKKINYHFIVFLIMGMIGMAQMQAQTRKFCETKNTKETTTKALVDALHTTTCGRYYSNEYCFTIYPQIVRKSDGSEAILESDVSDEIDRMKDTFRIHGINFIWEEPINYIDSNLYFNDPSLLFDSSHVSDSRIDMFFVGNDELPSAADGLGRGSALFVSSFFLGGGSTSHEMGHVLGLFHTFHSTIGCPVPATCENNDALGISNHIREHVIRYGEDPEGRPFPANACDSGDYVFDTPADNGYIGAPEGAPMDCVWNDDGFDENEDTYQGDLTNVMSYGTTECIQNLTTGQATRIKYLIEEAKLPHLLAALDNCPVPPDPCEGCTSAIGNANNLFENYLSNDGCVYTINFPTLALSCPDTYLVEWNGETGSLLETGDSISTTFLTTGPQSVLVTVIRDGLNCGPYEFIVNVDETCEPPCPDCEETLNTIVSSFGQEPSIGCDSYSIDIPDLGECFKGRVDWGDLTTDPFVSNSTILHSYTSSGPRTVVLELFDDNGDLCASESIVIQVNCPSSCLNPCDIEADFSYSNDGCVYTFVAENTASDCAMDTWSYQWRIDGALVGTSEILVFDFETLFDYVGPHNVRLRIKYDPVGCRDIIKKGIQVNSCAGQRPLLNDDISIYPNPTRDAFKIESKNDVDIAQFTVRDIHGSIITSRRNNFTDEINISNNPVGIYFVEIKFNNGQSLIKKLILQK